MFSNKKWASLKEHTRLMRFSFAFLCDWRPIKVKVGLLQPHMYSLVHPKTLLTVSSCGREEVYKLCRPHFPGI